MANWVDIKHEIVEQTAPASEPIALSEAKAFLRVDQNTHDSLISTLIATARRRVESDTGRSLKNTTWDLTADAFGDERMIRLPRVPLVSVTHIKTYDEDDSESTFSSSSYRVDTAFGRIALGDDQDWPSDLRTLGAVSIRFVAGYGTDNADVPQELKLAIYQLLTHWFENADPNVPQDSVNAAYSAHIAAYRLGQHFG